MPSQWYYVVNGQQGGPITSPKLKHLAITGRLSPDDLVWRDGMEDWEPASTLKGLFDEPADEAPEPATRQSRAVRPRQEPAPERLAPAPARLAKAPARAASAAIKSHPKDDTPARDFRKKTTGAKSRYGGFLARFAASIVDGMVVSVLLNGVFFGTLFAVFSAYQPQKPPQQAIALIGLLALVAGLVVPWLYFAMMEASEKQGTPGKRLFGLKVTDLHGDQISFAQASGRFFAKFLSQLPLLIGYIMAAFTEKHQALHDILAGTLVLKR